VHGLFCNVPPQYGPENPWGQRHEATGGSVFVETHVPPFKHWVDDERLQGLSK
jgi:hypothetical protein